MLEISSTHNNLSKDGKPFFYLADTCWSAFTNIDDEEWEYYLAKRKAQGFNTLQINILPQWDASQTRLDHKPFAEQDGKWNYSQLNPAYFEHARKMCLRAREQGFELALVVLWCNYVPDTWASKFYPKGIMPKEAIKPYVDLVSRTFSDLDPIYIISGDTDFNTPECESYYIEACTQLKQLAPDSLYTTHIKGRYSYIPPALEKQLDFLMFQSGHNHKDLSMPYTLAEKMRELYPNKPLINAEPCYEEMGFSGGENGQWTRRDIRRAAWESLLSGAGAGITYGAAGIYSWHKIGMFFGSEIGEGFAAPKAWQEAINFPGAWDYGFMRYLCALYQLYDLRPNQQLLVKDNPKIRVSQTGNGTLVLYVPYNMDLVLQQNLQDKKGIAVDLNNRYVSELEFRFDQQTTKIEKPFFHEDMIYIID